jgi:hypothetical protein
MILTVPGNRLCFENVSSTSIGSSSPLSLLKSDTISSVSHSSKCHGELEDLNIPEAAAWVSVGELRDAEGLLRPPEFRAMRMCDGLVDIYSYVRRDASLSVAIRFV